MNPAIDMPNSKLIKCCPLKVIGEPDIMPLNFKKAIIDPVNVIAPIEAPNDISIKLAILILPRDPKLNISGFRKADIATKTAAKPTRLWNPATSSGIAVIGILNAINAPMEPPISKNIKRYIKPVEKFPTETKVTTIAIPMPKIPKKLPCLDVSGEDRPLKAKINNIPETK
tara:strand:- start:59 stop:571 length:513 start_codon:yes stop_codon:yes gene_type:complete